MEFSTDKEALDAGDGGKRQRETVPDQFGRYLNQHHEQLESLSVSDGFERVANLVSQLIHGLSAVEPPLNPELTNHFNVLVTSRLQSCKALLANRGQAGFVKSLHTKQLHKQSDSQNFNPGYYMDSGLEVGLASCDVLFHLAFLIMNLNKKPCRVSENRILSQYLTYSAIENTSALTLMPLFLACCAARRAIEGGMSVDSDKKAQATWKVESSSFLESAIDFLSPNHPTLVAIGGMSGSGKSTTSRQLSEQIAVRPGAILLRSDVERKVLAGIEETNSLPASHYSEQQAVQLHQHLRQKATSALNAGYSVVVDATFIRESEQQRIQEIAQACEANFIGFWLSAPYETLRNRMLMRQNDASDATLEVLSRQLRQKPSAAGWHTVDASGTATETLAHCLARLAQ